MIVFRLICLTAGCSAFFPIAVAQNAETPDSIDARSLQEIVVTGQSARQRISNGRLGSEKLEIGKLSLTPQLLGEKDIIKSMTLLPGVNSEGDGAGGFEVRGGNAYQNLVTIDGMSLYNPMHLMGIFSTFNEDAMSQATLHKGPVPAQFGEASSSVLETSMKPGDMEQLNFTGTVGILNAKVAANGPIIKDKLSFSVAARRSYIDLFLKLVPKYRKTILNFGDVNAKLRYRPDRDNTVDISFFASRDNLALKDLMSMKWGNISGAVNWQNRKVDNWLFTTTAAVTDYSGTMWMDLMDSRKELAVGIRNVSLNERALFSISDNHALDLGARSELTRVNQGEAEMYSQKLYEVRSGWQNSIWTSYEGTPFGWLSISAGVRLSVFTTVTGNGLSKFHSINYETPDYSSKVYLSAEPRVAFKFIINENHNIKAGFSSTTQNIHGIRSTTTTFPFDRYVLSSAQVKPEQTRLNSIGYSGMTGNGDWDWSAEVYYKSMDNIYDYKDGATMFSRIDMESIILGGEGRSYGLELMLRKNSGKLNGWVSYTLSKTQTRIEGINGGRWYNASNDRRHNISVVGIYTFNPKWTLSAAWTFTSGRPLTAPDVKYQVSGTTCYYYSQRNGYKTPPSHRLDVSATYTKVGLHVTQIVNFGFFNAYAHYSPFVVFFRDDPTKPSGTQAVQQSLFGIVPSISYTIKF